MTQPLATIPDLEPYIDLSGSGTGSGYPSHSGSGSGDLEKEIPDLEKFGDSDTLSDDEDFKHLPTAVAGGAAVRRRRSRSVVQMYGVQQDRLVSHTAVEEKSQNENDADSLPMKDSSVSGSDAVVFEYEDRYDNRNSMLQFER